jgi:hypothetical protein
MRRTLTVLITLLFATVMAGSSAMAAEVLTVNFENGPGGAHFVQGTPPPTCTVSGLYVTCPTLAFELAGVGNTNASAALTVFYSAIIDCNNPSENNKNNPIESHEGAFSASTSSGDISPKNGRLTISPLTVEAPTEADILAQADCPNEQWVPEVHEGSLQLVSYTFTVTFAGEDAAAITITGP